jgi:hypothetical protein
MGLTGIQPELEHMITTLAPELIILTETKLYSCQHNKLSSTRAILKDYTTIFSSRPAPPALNKQDRYTRYKTASAGVILAIDKRLSAGKALNRVNTPEQLNGYLIHITLPSQTYGLVHILAVYIVPGDPEVRQHVNMYIQDIHKHSSLNKELLIVSGDLNSTLYIQDSTNPSHRQDPSHLAMVNSLPLQPIDHDTSPRLPTYIKISAGNNITTSTHGYYASRIDDVLSHPPLQGNITTLDSTGNSDHLPLLATFPPKTLGLISQNPAPPPLPRNKINFPSRKDMEELKPKLETNMTDLQHSFCALLNHTTQEELTKHRSNTPLDCTRQDIETAAHNILKLVLHCRETMNQDLNKKQPNHSKPHKGFSHSSNKIKKQDHRLAQKQDSITHQIRTNPPAREELLPKLLEVKEQRKLIRQAENRLRHKAFRTKMKTMFIVKRKFVNRLIINTT